MNARNLVVLLLVAGCQPSAGPLSLAHDYAVAPAPYGVQHQGLTTGDGPNHSHLIFLNFDGAMIVPSSNGYQDDSANNQSWMAKSTRTIPAFDATPYASQYTRDAAIAWITNQYRTYYAAYNVTVVTARPASGRYEMVMIGGRPADLQGGSNNTSEAGVSPMDCGNSEEANISFCFAATLAPGSTGFGIADAIMQVAADAAHESGHAFGLEHVDDSTDIMHPVLDPSITGFHGVNNLSDGSSSCGGGNTQDTAGRLLANLGPSTGMPVVTPPTVSFQSPSDGAAVALSFDVTVNAAAASGATITKVELMVNNKLAGSVTTSPYQFSLTETMGGSYTLKATAYDSNSQSSSSTVTVTASAGSQPQPMPSMPPNPNPSGCSPACPSGMQCQSDGSCAPTISTGIPTGGACTSATQCASGLCTVTNGVGTCTAHCDPGQPASCPSGQMCTTSPLGNFCSAAGGGSDDGGCSAAGPGRDSGGLFFMMFGMLALLGLRRRLS